MSMFIGRQKEFRALEERYASGRAEFLLLYGRRRVGKSELLEKFLDRKGIRGIRLLAREESKKLQLARFKEKLAEFFNDELLRKTEFSGWDSFFEYITGKAAERVIIAVDEFPYLVKEDASLPSVIQDYWDSKLRKTKIFFVLSGSSIKMMESLMGYKSPLYGRRTGQILLRPLKFAEIFDAAKYMENAVQTYSVFGGTPAYIIEADFGKTLEENIREKILREDSFIYKDVEFVLRQELEEPRYYFSILLSISRGNHTIGLICNDAGLSKSVVNKYLSVLTDLQLVKREIPVTEGYKSKKGLYFLSDNLFYFWFRFLYPNIEQIESGKAENVLNRSIKPFLNEHIGRRFENIILEILNEDLIENFSGMKIGRWWQKDKEIDIVGINDRTGQMIAAECKWKKTNAAEVVNGLAKKTEFIEWRKEKRMESFAVFAKSFIKRIKEYDGKDVYCYDLKDLERLLRGKHIHK